MVISSTNEGRRRSVSFGRVALEDGRAIDVPFELSRNLGLANQGIQTLTWVYSRPDTDLSRINR